MGLFPLTYFRPRHVDGRDAGQSGVEVKSGGSVKSGQSGFPNTIPDSLTFDNILSGGTCPPMTVRDFMNYLIYVEHSAENLQFYLWYQDYLKRFENAPAKDVSLSPEWTQTMEDETVSRIRRDQMEKNRSDLQIAQIFQAISLEKIVYDTPASPNIPFHTPPRSPIADSESSSVFSGSRTVPSTAVTTSTASYKSRAADCFQLAGAKLPFTIQPFRDEINRVVATYIMDGSPRQLNLASWEQKAAVQALSYTTHPSAMRGLFKTVDSALRRQAHPNFVRWSVCNGNPARVCFARVLGVLVVVAGFAIAIPLTLSKLARGYRALAAIAWVIGVSTLVAAYKGMCIVLHGMHHRHVKPWELFVQAGEDDASKQSFDSFGSENSYEDEPWVVKYERRNLVRKVFDREVWVQEPALRRIQDTIFVQAILVSVLVSGALTAIFVSVPGGDLF